jgi:repressor LexA
VEPVEPASPGTVSLPLLGVVAAGTPIEAVEVAESFDVPADLVPRGGQGYVLRVRGDSMIEDQIRDGDYVVVESRSEAQDGETVVALIRGEEATLKKLYREGSTIRLQPANETMESFSVPAEELEVRGVVRGLVRRY